MRTLLTLAIVVLAATVVVTPAAEAKRFGGGLNLGKQYSAPRSAPQKPLQQTAPSRPPAAPGARSGASRWLGPLAGLAAGGLLASLFFGDAFQGVQPLDLLLIAALAIGGVLLFRAMRRGVPSPLRGSAYAGGGEGTAPGDTGFLPPSAGRAAPSAISGEDQAPLWFDGPAFLEGAKTHFIRLQAAWDQADFRDLKEYTTPQLFAELERERRRLGSDMQYTEVVTLDAQLSGVRRDGDLAVASILFSGLIREDEHAAANPFREIWHVQHAWDHRDGDWFITGIQQTAD
jgi:predicted lipid-binding transport protein (Tim44 family)